MLHSECPQFLRAPFNMVINGPTQIGKTTWTAKLLVSDCIEPKPDKIVWMYSEEQPIYEKIQQDLGARITFHQGWSPQVFDQFISSENNLIVIDDLISACSNDTSIGDLFTRGSHHRNISCILITQNYFWGGASAVTVRRNTHYLVTFACKQDARQISRFGQQILPGKNKFFQEAYDDATKRPRGYLLIDMHHSCPVEYMLRTNIVEKPITVYVDDQSYR